MFLILTEQRFTATKLADVTQAIKRTASVKVSHEVKTKTS